MKKIVKLVLLVSIIIIFLLIIAMIAIPFLISKEAVKNFAVQRISEAINRTVSIEGVSFNLFEGIKLEGIYVSNSKSFSEKPFIRAESFNLKYAFWPLFVGKVWIDRVELVQPEILIEKDARGKISLDDLVSGGKKQTQKKGNNIDLVINNFSVKNGRFTYHDHLVGISEIKNLNLKISGITLAFLRPIDANASATASYLKKDIPISLSSQIQIDPSLENMAISKLLVNIAGESFSCPIEIKNLKAGPNIAFNLSSKNLSIDTLIGLFASTGRTPVEKPKPGQLTRSLKTSIKSIPDTLNIKGSISIEKAVFQKMKFDHFNTDLSLSGKKIWIKTKNLFGYNGKLSLDGRINLAKLTYDIKPINLKGLNASSFLSDLIDSFAPQLLNLKNKAEGTLDVFLSLSGEGIEMPEAFESLKAQGVVVLTKGRLKKIKSLAQIAEKYNLSFLKQDVMVKGLRVEGTLNKKVLDIKELDLKDTDLEAAFAGGLNFNNMRYQPGNRLTLRIGPDASKGLPGEFSVFKDVRGFVNVDFELDGSLYAPIPIPQLEKPIEKTIGKLKVKIEAKKVELEGQAKEAAQQEADKLKKKAEDKIKEILKF